MSLEHDQLAHKAAELLLAQLREGTATWATDRLSPHTTYWHGIADWPRPDGAFEDRSTGASLAIEFKPPSQSKREYVTGLGQVLTYLRSFEFAVLILPRYSYDGFAIADDLMANVQESFATNLPIGLFRYDTDPGNAADLTALVNLRARTGDAPGIPRGLNRQVFWAYWRDLSQYDVLSILTDMDAATRIPFDQAYRHFWDAQMITGTARTWEGDLRTAKNPASFDAEKLNAWLSLRHIGVLSSDGSLTERGYRVLHLGKVYGPASLAFMSYLGNLILGWGRHLELIFWVDDQQRKLPSAARSTADDYRKALDAALQTAGIIPYVPAGPKISFLRDELKLWNKLGLLLKSHGNQYFHPDVGLMFNWRAILATMDDR